MAPLLKNLGMRVICHTKGEEIKSSQLRVGKKTKQNKTIFKPIVLVDRLFLIYVKHRPQKGLVFLRLTRRFCRLSMTANLICSGQQMQECPPSQSQLRGPDSL